MSRLLTRRAVAVWLCPIVLLSLNLGCGSKGSTGPVFDIPALLGKNVDQVEATLGPAVASATTPPPADAAVEEARKTFQKDDHTLVVTYTPHNKEVTKFALGSGDGASPLKDENKAQFLRIGNLKTDDPRYTVNYVESEDKPFYYTGVEVAVKPVEHKLQLRVAGAGELLMVTYTVRPVAGAAKTDEFFTMPPWDMTITAVSGTYVSVSAVLFGRQRTRDPKFTVQVLVDGKVVKQSSSTGTTAQCSWLL